MMEEHIETCMFLDTPLLKVNTSDAEATFVQSTRTQDLL